MFENVRFLVTIRQAVFIALDANNLSPLMYKVEGVMLRLTLLLDQFSVLQIFFHWSSQLFERDRIEENE